MQPKSLHFKNWFTSCQDSYFTIQCKYNNLSKNMWGSHHFRNTDCQGYYFTDINVVTFSIENNKSLVVGKY